MRLQGACNEALQYKVLNKQNKSFKSELNNFASLSFKGLDKKSIDNESFSQALKAMTLVKPDLNLSFTSNQDPVSLFKSKLDVHLKANNIQTAPMIKPGGLPGWPFFYLPEQNELILDMRSIHMALHQGGEASFDKMVEAVSKTLEMNDKYGEQIVTTYNASAEKLAIKPNHVPSLVLCNIPAPPLGSSSEDGRMILFNTHWLEESNEAGYIFSEVLSHELSHTKTQLLYGDFRSNGFNQSMDSDVDKKKYYNTIGNFLSSEQSTPNSMQFKMALKRIIDDVANISGLAPKEMAIINLKALQEGKLECGNVLIVDALFNKSQKQAILDKVEKNKDALQAYLSNAHFDKVRDGFDNTYKKNCDEILARHNQLLITQEHINDGTIIIKDPEFKEKILSEKPEETTDKSFKEIHRSTIL